MGNSFAIILLGLAVILQTFRMSAIQQQVQDNRAVITEQTKVLRTLAGLGDT